MRLCTARQRHTFWCKLVMLGILDVDGRRRCPIHVAVLGEIEAPKVGAEGGQQDIFVVGIGAIGTFEGGRERSLESRARYEAVSIRKSGWMIKRLLPALRRAEAMPSLLTFWSVMMSWLCMRTGY